MDKDIKTLNDVVVAMDGILVKQKRNREMMNLHNKTFMELNKDELQREIDYLWGQYDFVSQSEVLPSEYRIKKAKYLWNEIDALTTRYLFKSMDSVRDTMNYISDEMKGMRSKWDN